MQVRIYTAGGTKVATTTTDWRGIYRFNVAAGSYYIEFDVPDGYYPSPKDMGLNDARDSDIFVNPGNTDVFTLDPGEIDLSWDAGFFKYAALGDYVWVDANCNGIQEGSESGLANVMVRAYLPGGHLLASTYTNAQGFYGFIGTPGSYFLEFELVDDYTFSPKDRGGDNGRDSDADPVTGRTVVFTLPYGKLDYTWDVGVCSQETEPTPTQTATPTQVSEPTPTPTQEWDDKRFLIPVTGGDALGAASQGLSAGSEQRFAFNANTLLSSLLLFMGLGIVMIGASLWRSRME